MKVKYNDDVRICELDIYREEPEGEVIQIPDTFMGGIYVFHSSKKKQKNS